ncbi:Phage-related lysozyme (muramidase), GH24 family [Maricaulis salignorans]|uniref:Lysozyme n=2 Tax=Maricaulis salignorans TaxID=144026 RepID=A0A1G9VVQ5_9PROT|nr:Phage-related lysozyme (muramidase), GH24 family [Maricaulis salignorans]
MKPQMKSSPAARALIQRFEPYRERAAQGSDGRWRVGFGHRAAAREGVRVSREDAALLLIYDVMQAEAAVDEIFPARLPDSQRDALTSFVHDIGPAAFRNSDVARYMFEGRVEAAAEALASYGESNSARREAESAMILAGLAPERGAGRKPAMVDVVIKVEHAGDADQPAAATPPATRPALPGSIMPPPAPPVLSRQLAARREAEQEIARILATVGAMPHEDADDQPEIVRPDPAPESPAAAEVEAASEPVPEPEPEAEVEVEVEPETEPEAEPVDQPGGDAPQGITVPEPLVAEEHAVSAEPADSPVQESAPAPASAQVIARMSQEIAQVEIEISGRQASQTAPAAQGETLPDGVTLGYVFVRTISASLVLPDESRAEAVAPQFAVPSDDAAVKPDSDVAEALNEADLPIEDQPTDAPEVEPEVAPEAISEPESEPDPELDPEPESEPAPEAADVADAGDADSVPAAAAIVERALAVSGQRTPPPHPADTPAASAGAVGDIAGEGGQTRFGEDEIAHIDELAGLSQSADAGGDDDDALSPSDLVGDSDMFIESKPATSAGEEDGWGFVATLLAGLVVAGAGVLDIYGDWPRVWVERDPTWGVLAAVGGTFLAVTAGWMLTSVLAAKRRRRRAG